MCKSKVRSSLFFLAAVVATMLTLSAVNGVSAYEAHSAKMTSQSEVLVLLAQR